MGSQFSILVSISAGSGVESLIQGQLKSHLFPAWILAIAINLYSYSNKLAISTFYFYELLLFQIFVPWKFTFTANSHADNRFYKCIYLFQIFYSMKYFFLWKYIKAFYIQTVFLFFQIKTMVYRKKLSLGKTISFSVDYIKIELNVVWHDITWIWVDEKTGLMISTKRVNKN